MSDTSPARCLLLRAFVSLISYLVVAGWVLSCAKALQWMLVAAGLGVCLVGAMWVWRVGSPRLALRSVIEPLSFWPFLLLMALRLIGAVAYPPTMLDSLTYRLPRIWLWLQEGGVHHVVTSEARLNYMPQVWELSTVPLILLAGDHLVWVWTFASWIVVYLVTYDWALDLGGDLRDSRWMAFMASTSAFAVLQAGSAANDLFATALVLLSLRFVVSFERTRDWRWIGWAVLGFCLAAGTKPHYSVLGLPLAAWFLLARSKPWKSFRWAWTPLLVPLWLLCSPAMTFALNFLTYGTWAGPGQDYVITGRSPLWNVLLGSVSVMWHTVQPPVNPFALLLNGPLDRVVAVGNLNELLPQMTLRVKPFSMVDGAALGLVSSVLLAAGMAWALKRQKGAWKSWQGWALWAGCAGVWLALSRFVPGTAGRAYCGFLHLAIPLALVGWHWMKPRTLRIAVYVCLINSIVLAVFDPARPLWPVGQMQRALAASPRFNRLSQLMEPYLLVPERARTGEEIARAVPANESVLALIPEDRPLLPLFRPYHSGRKVLFLPPGSELSDFVRLRVDYVVICEGAELSYPEQCALVEQSGKYEMVVQRSYTSRLARGPEMWTLYRRRLSAGNQHNDEAPRN